jgi:hypothetical protein
LANKSHTAAFCTLQKEKNSPCKTNILKNLIYGMFKLSIVDRGEGLEAGGMAKRLH